MFGSQYAQNNGEVFTWPDGRPFRLDYITQRFKEIIRKIPELDDRLHFHSLRASCISNLFAEDYGLKEVQKWVGQSDVEVTLKIYNKFKQKQKNRISQGLDNTFRDINPLEKHGLFLFSRSV
ncbi:tyrosine-type recombinase/integrase [Mediterraneibacter glycyrrhizinilyticus]|uniref:tyrosine-type recombinase/integrase n=1 Tax=Mediterraneibacter glycyrrhizinilyticus TaxID=342942 RepID=UPI003045574D|nr:tyrosine-type recombinase/integrase [Mediterraneibacter glycyrrhizinilyticus]